MEYGTILYEVTDNILTITLNRPDKLNTFSQMMIDELIDALKRSDADDDVRAVIITGAGKAFSAGADLGNDVNFIERYKQFSKEEVRNYRDGAGTITLAIYEMQKPVIGAINGVAAGMGATIILAMDIRLASENARFGFIFSKRGLITEGASSWFLPRLVGTAKALEWTLTGRVFDVREAEKYGLVQEVQASDVLMTRARTIANEIARNTSSMSVAINRQLIWRMAGAASPWDAHRIDSPGTLWAFTSPEGAEGVAAFLEKRLPHFPLKLSKDKPDFYPWWK